MSPRTTTVIFVLTAAALGSWYLARPDAKTDVEREATSPVHRGYYLDEARILGTGDDGSLLYEIEAEHAEQLEDDSIEFTAVRLRYSPERDVPWIVNAEKATLSKDSPRITLRGNVRALSKGDADKDDTEIFTQYLELDPERFIAETDARVQIRFGARSLTATGMLASLNDDRIELKSNVSGKIVP